MTNTSKRRFKASFAFKLFLSVILIVFVSGLIDSVRCDVAQNNTVSSTSATLVNSSAVTQVKQNTSTSSTPQPSQNVTNDNKIVELASSAVPPEAEKKDDANKTKTDESKAVEQEHNNSMAIFFVLCVIALGILLIHTMLETGFQYLPESIVVVFLGALIGLLINLLSEQNVSNWKREQVFSPTAFFLVLLPPIIFESGYNLHKGNFFQNIGSILAFAIVGTTISAFTIGAGIYILGLADVAYRCKLFCVVIKIVLTNCKQFSPYFPVNFVESFAFGSLISSVDPVATVAIFHAIDVDPVLNMLVFGESILNGICFVQFSCYSQIIFKELLNFFLKKQQILISKFRLIQMPSLLYLQRQYRAYPTQTLVKRLHRHSKHSLRCSLRQPELEWYLL